MFLYSSQTLLFMDVYVAEPCGFCFGAERVIKLAERAGKAYSLGPLLHNEILVEKLKKQGIEPLSFEEIVKREADKIKKVIIRAHGVPIDQINKLKQKGFEIIDGTCPKIKYIYKITSEYESQGYKIIIFGEKKHPEVISIVSRLKDPIVVKEDDDVHEYENACLVSQTTQREDLYKKIKGALIEKCKRSSMFDTICNATKERQEAASDLAMQVQVMLVIGGKKSSNTKRLYEVCEQKNTNTYLIQSGKDLEKKWFNGIENTGVTAGASTPDFVIASVVNELEKY